MHSATINCPLCRNAVALDANLAGMNVLCPHCSRRFLMPSLTSLAFTGAEDLWGGMVEGGTALPPEEISPSLLPDPVYKMHLDDVVPMAETFLKLKPHEVKPEHVEFKIMPELQKRVQKSQENLAAWQNVLKGVTTRELEMAMYRKQAWQQREISKNQTPPDNVTAEYWNTEMIRREQASLHHQEPGVVDPDTHAAPKGMAEVKRVVNVLIARAAHRLKKYQDKYQHAADILNDPAHGKLLLQLPGMRFNAQGKFETDPELMNFDADGNLAIGYDSKGKKINYLKQDPKTGRIDFHPDQTGGPVRRFFRRWLGL